MSESREHVSIRLEVHVPVGAGAIVQTGPPSLRDGEPTKATATTVPAANDLHRVRPRNNSGLGTICARAEFSTAVTDVFAKVYPEANATPHPAPPTSAVAGVNTTGRVWVWDDPSNPVLHADHAPASHPVNTLVIWYKEGGTQQILPVINFRGQTGGNNPCGSGPATLLAPTVLPPAALFATFTGTLSALGTIPLRWDGANWVGATTCGRTQFVFRARGVAGYELQGVGASVAFQITAYPATATPFSWTSIGMSSGAIQGPFVVTVTE